MSAIRIAINGFGRIGRMSLRVLLERKNMEIVAINDLTDSRTLAHLFKYDSIHGKFKGEIRAEENAIIINGKTIPVTREKDPAGLKWGAYNTDIVIESTGKFLDRASASQHITAGAKKVVLSAPANNNDIWSLV